MEVCQLPECLCEAPNHHGGVNKAADNPGSPNTEVDIFIFLSLSFSSWPSRDKCYTTGGLCSCKCYNIIPLPPFYFSSFMCHVRDDDRDSLPLRSLRAAFILVEKHTLQSHHRSVGTARSPAWLKCLPICQGHSWSLHGAGGCSSETDLIPGILLYPTPTGSPG